MYVLVSIGLIVVLGLGWFYWLSTMFGGNSDEQSLFRIDADLDVDCDGDECTVGDYVRPTPFRVAFDRPTLTPTVTSARYGQPTPGTVAPQTMTPPSLDTPVPAASIVPSLTPVPSPSPTPGEAVQVTVQHYWPDEGPDWCLTWDQEAQRCVSPLTSGDDFRRLDGQALACDPEWLGKTLSIPDLDLVLPCLDTGVSFGCDGGPCAVGLLSSKAVQVDGMYQAYLLGSW